MQESERRYLYLILLHIAIGFAIYSFPFFSKVYAFTMLIGGVFYVINSQNQNNEVLYVAAYIVGSEAVLRMTGGNPLYEFSKYSIVLLMFIGIYYKGISKNAIAYWVFLLLLFPGVFIAAYTLNYDNDIRNRISFNTSGPICLGVCSLYCYARRVTFKQINEILLLCGLPIITTAVYLTLYTPSVREVITGTGSNYATSGGFGPNQVSTVLGLGMFIFAARLIYYSNSKVLFLINFIIALVISYRGLVTFSRGGMMTGFMMILIVVVLTYFKINSKARVKMNYVLITITTVLIATWLYTSNETGGLIEKRYANENASGIEKKDQFTGRVRLAEEEISNFLENPIFGIGVGRTAEIRQQETGAFIVSHNEITRMLAEHGSLGVLGLIILLTTPLFLYLDNKQHVYLLCFIVFWILTINHAAMRLAAPAFIYSLSLLKVVINEKTPTIHRK